MGLDVVGIDDFPVVDILLWVDRLPKTNESIFSQGQSWQGGGKVPTALTALGRLGASCGLTAIVGADALGRFCIDDLERHHVDTSHVIVDPGNTTTYTVVLAERSTAGRSFVGNWGTCRQLTPQDIDPEQIASAKYLHLWKMTPATIRAAEIAREHGVKVVFDGDDYQPAVMEHLDLIDILVGSEFFFQGLGAANCSEACRMLLERGPQIAVITLGSRGCAGMDREEGYFELPAFSGFEVVDTTGAGDVFHGAFLFGLLKGMKTKECARFASAVSAIKCMYPGGRAGIPDLKTVQKFLQGEEWDTSELESRVEFYSRCSLAANVDDRNK